MPLLQVRDIPEDLYEDLARVAKAENRSIAQETIVLLRGALNNTMERKARRRKVLEQAEEMSVDSADSFADPADLIREDRQR